MNTATQNEKAKNEPESFSELGCILDCSADSVDSINERTIDFAEPFGFKAGLPNEDDEDYSQVLSEIADDAVSFLNENLTLPSYCSFFFEDNSLFCLPSIDMAKEDVGFISGQSPYDENDSDYPTSDYEGEWLHVNDHGNVTLYVREAGQDKEIWSLV